MILQKFKNRFSRHYWILIYIHYSTTLSGVEQIIPSPKNAVELYYNKLFQRKHILLLSLWLLLLLLLLLSQQQQQQRCN